MGAKGLAVSKVVDGNHQVVPMLRGDWVAP